VALAQNQTLLQMADMANAWGLTLIGLSLLLGLLTRVSAVAGMILLLFYYLSHPPFPGIESIFPSDGSYFIVNKTLVEMVALWVVFAFPTSQFIGLARFFKKTDLS
jgi:thiosulfate dehydrogenase [quinone] large subunit